HDTAALGAVGVFRGVAGHVANVNVVQTLGIGDGLGPFQSLHRRVGKVGQQILGMETREVYGDVRAQVGLHPPRHGLEFRVSVVQGRDHQVHNLGPRSLFL